MPCILESGSSETHLSLRVDSRKADWALWWCSSYPHVRKTALHPIFKNESPSVHASLFQVAYFCNSHCLWCLQSSETSIRGFTNDPLPLISGVLHCFTEMLIFNLFYINISVHCFQATKIMWLGHLTLSYYSLAVYIAMFSEWSVSLLYHGWSQIAYTDLNFMHLHGLHVLAVLRLKPGIIYARQVLYF